MVKNYFLVAWRSIRKHKIFTAINIVGLSLSMSVCLLLILLVYDHYQYDTFHPKGDRTFRVLTGPPVAKKSMLAPMYATSPLPLNETLSEKYTAIETITNLNHSFRGELRSPHKVMQTKSLYADEKFFDVFGFELLEGDKSTALTDPFSLVLTEELANKLFPGGNAYGQLVEFEEQGSYEVTGIVKKPLQKSHITFDALGSFSTIANLSENGKFDPEYKNWENIWMNYTYMVLKDDAAKAEVEALVNETALANMKLDEDHEGYSFELQKITEVVPGRLLNNEITFTLPKIVLAFFGFLGIIVIITATINYANLSVAKSLSRAKEIGIRKVNGASGTQIMIQFLVESVLIALLSLGVAILIYLFLLDSFNELWIFNQVGIQLQDTVHAYIFFVLFTVLLGLVTGIGPSYFFSKIDTVKSLKGSAFSELKYRKGISKFFSGKKVLLGVQFGLSIIMLVTIFLIRDQASYLSSSKHGFDEENTYYVELQGHDPDVMKAEFSSIPGINKVAFTSHHPAIGVSYGNGMKRKPEDEFTTIYHFSVDEAYVDVMNLELVAGNDFPVMANMEKELFIILNETAVQKLGFKTPMDAVGETVLYEDGTQVKVIGIVKDYHWEPQIKDIKSLSLRIKPEEYQLAYFDVQTNHPHELSKEIEAKWNGFDTAREYKGGFLNAELDIFYQFMYDLGGILTLISLIAISITSLGFLGMVSFHLKTRVKEIGIRKVLGATFSQITYSMTRGFIIMLVITCIITIPLALFVNSLWINRMAKHSPISLWNVGPAVLVILILSGAAIFSQVWKSTTENPVDSLKSE